MPQAADAQRAFGQCSQYHGLIFRWCCVGFGLNDPCWIPSNLGYSMAPVEVIEQAWSYL